MSPRVEFEQAMSSNHLSLQTVDCVYGPWVWGECLVTCGNGFQIGRREITTQAVGDGTPCNQPLVDFRACSAGGACPGKNLA